MNGERAELLAVAGVLAEHSEVEAQELMGAAQVNDRIRKETQDVRAGRTFSTDTHLTVKGRDGYMHSYSCPVTLDEYRRREARASRPQPPVERKHTEGCYRRVRAGANYAEIHRVCPHHFSLR